MPASRTTHIRWMIRRDMIEVNQIDESTDIRMPEEEMLRVLRQRNCIGMVGEVGDRVVAYMIYELHKTRLELLRFAVHPEYRRKGVGTAMLKKLKDKLSRHRRTRLQCIVPETCIDLLMFFRDQCLTAKVPILDEHFGVCDGIVMRYDLPQSDEEDEEQDE